MKANADDILHTFLDEGATVLLQSITGRPKKKTDKIQTEAKQQLADGLVAVLPPEEDYRGNGSDYNKYREEAITAIYAYFGIGRNHG